VKATSWTRREALGHLSNIFTKAGVSTRSAATAFAFQHDMIEQNR
jgi:DNA-binding CsgD family transcriptional regulator